MKTLLILPLLLAVIGLASCSKNLDDPSENPSNLSELKVSPQFTWSTGKFIEISITGLPTPIPVYSTLSIGLSDGSNIYQARHNINSNTSISVIVPATTDSINIRFGSNEYKLPVGAGKVDFSFIPLVQD
jgi:hypothetical protein